MQLGQSRILLTAISLCRLECSYDVDPIAKTATLFGNIPFDGMTMSPDGSILYGANLGNGNIEGYNTTTKALVFQSGVIARRHRRFDCSGTAALAGNIFVNTNGGTVVEVNLATKAQTLIAAGGLAGTLWRLTRTTARYC